MSRNIVIIPTYNEKENVEKIIRKVFSLYEDFSILIIDDGSPDGTANIVKGLQGEFPERLFLIERSGKLGLGTAYITGFKWCCEHGYDYIFEPRLEKHRSFLPWTAVSRNCTTSVSTKFAAAAGKSDISSPSPIPNCWALRAAWSAVCLAVRFCKTAS